MALSDEELGRLTRQAKTLSSEIEELKKTMSKMGKDLSFVAQGLQSPDTFDYWSNPHKVATITPANNATCTYHGTEKTIQESAKTISEYHAKKQELETVKHHLSLG